jgi:hypothetical protein
MAGFFNAKRPNKWSVKGVKFVDIYVVLKVAISSLLEHD